MFDSDRIIAVRKALDLSENKFSQKIGVPQSTYHKFERGESKLTIEVFPNLIKEFNVNVGWLLTGEGEMFDPNNKNTITLEKEEYHNLIHQNLILTQKLNKYYEKELEKKDEIIARLAN